MSSLQTKCIKLVRHAKLVSDTSGLFIGRTDLQACTSSSQQLAEMLQTKPFGAVVSSPLQRCRTLAEQVAKSNKLQVDYLDGLQERDWGSWDGLHSADIKPSELQAYYDDPFHYAIPQAESWDQMRARLNQAWSLLLNHPAQDLLCVTHGGVLRLLMQQILGLTDQALFQLKLDYGVQILLEVTPTQTQPFVQLVEIRPGNL